MWVGSEGTEESVGGLWWMFNLLFLSHLEQGIWFSWGILFSITYLNAHFPIHFFTVFTYALFIFLRGMVRSHHSVYSLPFSLVKSINCATLIHNSFINQFY